MPTFINRSQKKDKDISVVDSTDVKILNALQANARISNAELAELVNLSQTPCLRRLRKLEKSGLIQHYTTCLDHSMLGINVSAFVFIKLNKNTSAKAAEFEAAINQFPEILECCVLAGVHDYALRIVTKNLQTFESFLNWLMSSRSRISNPLSSSIKP